MLKTQMILDKKIYIDESTSSTNMSLKITKKPKVVYKRNKDHKALQNISKGRNIHNNTTSIYKKPTNKKKKYQTTYTDKREQDKIPKNVKHMMFLHCWK